MARPKKQQEVINEEAIEASQQIESTNEIIANEQNESIDGDSEPLQSGENLAPQDEFPKSKVMVITPAVIKTESIRLIPLLVDAIRFLLSKKPLTPTANEIIKKRLESANILLDAVKRMDV